MKIVFLALAALVLLVAASEASAHGGGSRVIVVDQFGNVVSSRNVGGGYGYYGVQRGVTFGNSRNFGNVNPFNQNGGRNRIGFRR